VLFNDLLVYGSERLGAAGMYSLHRKMELKEVYIVDSGEEERSFIVANKAKSFVVQCKVRCSIEGAWLCDGWELSFVFLL
jgi:hypothetical protein